MTLAYHGMARRKVTMNLQQALEHANALTFPGFITSPDELNADRRANEEAIALLFDAWRTAEPGKESFSFDLVRNLAERNRALCDRLDESLLRDLPGLNLPRRLDDASLLAGIARMQNRSVQEVGASAGAGLSDLGFAYAEKAVSGYVLGVDIETTSRNPDRGYIINLGLAFMRLATDAEPIDGHSAYFGIPETYADSGVPLADIHHISWEDLAGKPAFTADTAVHKALLAAFEAVPVLAHNAAFEDAWFTFSLPGYAESRKAGRIALVDTRDICRRIDPDVRLLPRESHPATLENWALRRSTLKPGQQERHLGLDDVFLMLRTVREEFALRSMLPGQR